MRENFGSLDSSLQACLDRSAFYSCCSALAVSATSHKETFVGEQPGS